MEGTELKLGSKAEKRAFYKHVFSMTLPIALQNFMDVAVNSADVVMLSFVSQSALSASALAGQMTFVLQMLLNGIGSGAAVLSAQYWGKGDKNAVGRVMGIALRFSISLGLLFSLLTLLFPQVIMTIFTDDPVLIMEGSKYLRASSLSYVMGSFASVYLSVIRSTERVKMSAAVHCGAVFMNVILNACFIFGFVGFPKLGIAGVALATSITRVVEAIICAVDGKINKRVCLKWKYLFTKGGVLMEDFIRMSLPAAINDMVWGLAFSVYSIILGHLSSDIVAANSVASVVRNLGSVVCFGVASSAAIILGKTMGDNRLSYAKVYASRFAKLSVGTAIVGGILILLLRPVILDFMYLYVTVTDTVKQELSTMLYINSYYIMGGSVNTMLICGIFRSGGDVRFGMICDIIAMWVYAVPMGLFCAFILKIPEMWVYFVLCLDEFVKMPVIIHHYKKMDWIRNITRMDA